MMNQLWLPHKSDGGEVFLSAMEAANDAGFLNKVST